MLQTWNNAAKGLIVVGMLLVFGAGCTTSKQAAKVDEGAMKAPESKPDAGRDTRRAETVVTPSAGQSIAAAMPASQPASESFAISEAIAALQRELQDIHFEFDKYDLTDKARNILSQNAKILQGNTKVKIIVEGHCDERGTVEYNMALGEKRANSTRDYLINLGIPGSRMQTVSYGEEKPVDTGHTEEAWARNRRAHLLVTE